MEKSLLKEMEATSTNTDSKVKKKSLNFRLIRKIFLPHLHIKLGSMKNSVTPVDQNFSWFLYLKQKPSRISEAKSKNGYLWTQKLEKL
jgi:hypothetical protein